MKWDEIKDTPDGEGLDPFCEVIEIPVVRDLCQDITANFYEFVYDPWSNQKKGEIPFIPIFYDTTGSDPNYPLCQDITCILLD